MQRILVSGVSGPIGAALLPSLQSQGAEVVRLARGPARGPNEVSWDFNGPLSPGLVSGFDAVIHLAGESVFGRWNAAKKKAIVDSRVLGTSGLASALSQAQEPPKIFVCASAVGYYGNRGDEILTEESASGDDFPSEVCRLWESASQIAAKAGIRTVNLRIGMVLSPKDGALGKMLTPFKLGLGGRLGSGRQWSSWIHVDDVAGAVHHVMHTESLTGPVNMVAPNPVTNAVFTKTLGAVLRRPTILPVPKFAARLVFGEMADQLLFSGQRVIPERLLASGYGFRFTDLRNALEDLVG